MWANVLRVSGKRGTGTLITSSSTRTRSRLTPRPPPLPAATLALAGSHGQHGRLAIRRFFTSARVLSVSDGPSSSPSTSSSATTSSFEDPSRSGLFYHLVPPPTPLSDSRPAFALSLLADPPPSSESSTVLGWLPAETPGDDRVAGLNDFVENPRFLRLLHEAISEGLAEAVDDIQAAGALQLGVGWMHIHDERNIPPLNRIGDPDDILASVRVENGKILTETYEAMPSYRVCTAHGVTQLTEGLASKLHSLLEMRAREESRAANA